MDIVVSTDRLEVATQLITNLKFLDEKETSYVMGCVAALAFAKQNKINVDKKSDTG